MTQQKKNPAIANTKFPCKKSSIYRQFERKSSFYLEAFQFIQRKRNFCKPKSWKTPVKAWKARRGSSEGTFMRFSLSNNPIGALRSLKALDTKQTVSLMC